jgi:hypothetical protein
MNNFIKIVSNTENKKPKGRQWDGISRPSNDTYAKNWHDIFGKKEEEELRKSYEQSKLNKKERKK